MTTVTKEQPIVAVLQPIERQTITLTIFGETPLVVHRWSEKAKKEMRDKQTKQAKQKKDAKDPEADFNGARYIDDQGRDCFPAAGLKKAVMSAFRFADGIKKVEIAGALHVEGELIPIEGPPPIKREDMVRVGMGTADIRYRPEYRDWKMTFDVVYNARAISADQIINLFNIAGFGIGIGEQRPERGGSWGRFHV